MRQDADVVTTKRVMARQGGEVFSEEKGTLGGTSLLF
jgi:hypothetical protein